MKGFIQIDLSLPIKTHYQNKFVKHSDWKQPLTINNYKENFIKIHSDQRLDPNPDIANLMLKLSRGEITSDQYGEEINRIECDAYSSSRQP